MPLFNNRKGNAGTGRGIISNLGHRREAVKNLHSEAGFAGYHTGYGVGNDRKGDVFGNNNGPFSSPNGAQRLEAATAKARNAGVSTRKINKVVGKASKAGFSYGQQDKAFGTGKANKFTSKQRFK